MIVRGGLRVFGRKRKSLAERFQHDSSLERHRDPERELGHPRRSGLEDEQDDNLD